ncbi:PD-(D/E)XK nuclease family protein [Candidatus Cloacimonadota bacterium]
MIHFKYIPLNEDLLRRTLDLPRKGDSLYLFPTRKSRQEALRLYLDDWDLSQHKFLTMDEWKESLYHTEKPILKEEKRTLALYQSISKESKEFFKIRNYHQSIEFAQNFFSFWEEIKEELICESDIIELLSQKESAGNWQVGTFHQLVRIRDNYLKFLEDYNYSDIIFADLPDLPSPSLPFGEIIVVNQFYFTRLEKHLLTKFSGNVLVVSQIPSDCFDEETLSISKDLNVDLFKPFLASKPKLYVSSDPLQMISQLSNTLAEFRKGTIIDFRFEQQSYAHLLDFTEFSRPLDLNFSSTLIYRFLQSMKELIGSVIWKGKPFLISLQPLVNLTSSDDIFTYFVADHVKREGMRKYLFDLIKNNYKYADLNLFQRDSNEFHSEFEVIFTLLQDLMKLRSINELNNHIIELKNLEFLLSDLSDSSDITEVFFSTLVDFEAIETIKLVDKWTDIFPGDIISNLLLLLLNYLKSKKITQIVERDCRYTITTLHNSRNLNFDELFILSLVEGVLPDRKHSQFLFSENQRKKLRLKTYDDITLRDKYYFFRLLTCSKQVHLFSQQDVEKNLEISSFLEELLLNDLLIEPAIEEEATLSKHIFHDLISDECKVPHKDVEITDDFFAFPFNINDIPQRKFTISFYPWERFRYRTFEYYLEDIEKLRKLEPELQMDFNPTLIGNIVHEIINLVWTRIINTYETRIFRHNFINNTKLYVREAIDNYLKYNKKFIYKSPHNFSDRYFHNIFISILKSGIENFLYSLHNELNMSDINISVYSEIGEFKDLPLFKLEDIDINLTGRPDLRIETDKIRYIFDYKTGRFERAKLTRFNPQLQFYEMLYSYDYKGKRSETAVRPYIYFVEQKQLEPISKRIDLEDSIIETLKNIIDAGYRVNEKKHTYENVKITRRDLRAKREVK